MNIAINFAATFTVVFFFSGLFAGFFSEMKNDRLFDICTKFVWASALGLPLSLIAIIWLS